MSFTIGDITERFSAILRLERGDAAFRITGLAPTQKAERDQLIFVSDPKHLQTALNSKAQAWVIDEKLVPLAPKDPPHLLSTQQVSLAMALIGREWLTPTLNRRAVREHAIHPSSVIDPSAKLGKGVIVGPLTTIGPRVEIGDHCVIGANTTIEAEVHMGERCHIHSQVFLGHGTELGKSCEIHPQTSIGTEGFGYAHDKMGRHHRLVHFGRVISGDRVQIGSNVSVDRGTFTDSSIGDGTIIDNHCHLAHNIEIGKGTIITAGFILAGSTKIGDHCVFGGRTSVSGHISIASHSQFAALSGVHKSVTKPGSYGGYPLQPLKESFKTYMTIAQLPKLRRNLNTVMKHLGLKEDKEQ